MMILHSAAASPFGRKVKLAAIHLGLDNRIDIRTANVNDESDPLFASNPVGKIPTLTLQDGTAVFDSRVILEYFDHLAGGDRILPADPPERLKALTLQAAVDGLMDAAILQIYERRYRPEDKLYEPWLDRQAAKVSRTLAALETNPPEIPPETSNTIHVGHIALACGLGYLDFRFEGTWRNDHPNLVAWLAKFEAAVPAFSQTRPE